MVPCGKSKGFLVINALSRLGGLCRSIEFQNLGIELIRQGHHFCQRIKVPGSRYNL